MRKIHSPFQKYSYLRCKGTTNLYAEVDADGIKSGRDVEIGVDGLCVVGFPGLFVIPVGLVWRMDSHSDIQADDESVYIKAQSGTGAQCNLLGEIGIIENTIVEGDALW